MGKTAAKETMGKTPIKEKKKRSLSITKEAVLIMLAGLTLFAVVVGLISQLTLTSVITAGMCKIVQSVGIVASDCVDGDSFDEYLDSKGASEDSISVLSSFQYICDDTNLCRLYIVKPDLENEKVIYSLCARGEDYPSLPLYEVGQVADITSDEYRECYEDIMNGSSDFEFAGHSEEADASGSNSYMTGMIPICNSSQEVVGVVCAEISYEWAEAVLAMANVGVISAVVLVALLCGFIFSRLMRARVTRPIKQISDEAERFAVTKTADGRNLAAVSSRRNELGQLALSIGAMEQEIVQSIDSIKKMSAEKEHLKAEMDIASRIQTSALPHTFPAFPDIREFDLYATMTPAKEVGGDFYDFFLIDDDHLALVIADVSGKGVPAALFMMESKVTLGNCALMMHEPAEILQAVNNKLASDEDEPMFVTVWLGILEISTGRMKCANGGHEYPVIQRAGGAFELFHDEHGVALGAMEDMSYEQYEIALEQGDAVVIYTDGVPEAMNAAGDFYGTDRLMAALNSQEGATALDLVEALKRDSDVFVGGAEQFDDFTVLALRYVGAPDGCIS